MATKAEAHKAQAQVDAHARKPKKSPGRKRRHAGRRTSRFGDDTMDRNAKRGAERRGGAVIEANAGKPSRKSTRGTIDRTKQGGALQVKATSRQHAPSTRATARRH